LVCDVDGCRNRADRFYAATFGCCGGSGGITGNVGPSLNNKCTADPAGFKAQVPQVREFLAKFGDDLPAEIGAQMDAFEERLG